MEILFENPFIIIIIIAIVSSLFKKKKNEDTHQPNRPSMGDHQRDRKGQFQEIKDIFQEVSRTLQEEKKPSVNTSQEVVQEPKENMPKEPSFSKIDFFSESKEESMDSKTAYQKKEHDLMINEQTLVSGVILSEVLGPPRAKKAYYKQRKR